MATWEQENLYRAAKALQNDDASSEVFRRLEQRYIEAWKTSSLDQVDVREDAYRMMRAISELRGELSALAAEPNIAAFNRRLRA